MIAFAGPTRAAPMDPSPERLVLQPPGLPAGQTCQSLAANPNGAVQLGIQPGAAGCRPNNAAFQNMVSELGMAIAPSAFYPARTTGLSGIVLTLEANWTRLNSDTSVQNADGSTTKYWHHGTRGARDKSTNDFRSVNDGPDSVLQVYSLKARKGLPFGLELVGSLGYIANTTLIVGGGDLRWAFLEGFRTGPMGIIPDVSVGGGVRSLAGSTKFYLTVASFDIKVSKPVPLADSATLTPTLGYQRLFIYGDSAIMDLTPNVDALQQCGYTGNDPQTGAPVCKNKLSNGADNNGDFNNNATFDRVRVHRHSALASLHYRYQMVFLGAQFGWDLTDPKDENPGIVGPRQWTLSLEGGTHF